MLSENKMLTVKELAALLRLSITETYRLIQSGELTHFRVGPGKGAIRIADSDVKEFLEKRRFGKQETNTQIAIRNQPMKHIKSKK